LNPDRNTEAHTRLKTYVGPLPTYYAAVRLELRNPNPDLNLDPDR